MPEKWRAFTDTMRDGLLTRRATARVDMNHKTASRWRRKVVAFLTPTEQRALSKIVEADETYCRRNYKGSTPLGRRARKHGARNGGARCLGKDKRSSCRGRASATRGRSSCQVLLPRRLW